MPCQPNAADGSSRPSAAHLHIWECYAVRHWDAILRDCCCTGGRLPGAPRCAGAASHGQACPLCLFSVCPLLHLLLERPAARRAGHTLALVLHARCLPKRPMAQAMAARSPHLVLPFCIELRDLAQQVAKGCTKPLIHRVCECASCVAADEVKTSCLIVRRHRRTCYALKLPYQGRMRPERRLPLHLHAGNSISLLILPCGPHRHADVRKLHLLGFHRLFSFHKGQLATTDAVA